MTQERRRRKKVHFKAEQLTCKGMIDQMLAAGHTLDEIVQAVKEKGEEIGRSSLHRYASNFERTADKFRKAREQAKVLIDAVRESGPNTDMQEVANSILTQAFVERLADLDQEEVRALPLDKLGKVLADLEKSATGRERLKLQVDKSVNAALALLKDELKAELGQHVELLDQIYRIVDQVGEKVKAQVN